MLYLFIYSVDFSKQQMVDIQISYQSLSSYHVNKFF